MPPSPRPSAEWQVANDAAIAAALAADEVVRTTPSPAKNANNATTTTTTPTPSAPPLFPGDPALAAAAQAAADAAGAAAFYDTTTHLTRSRTSEDPCASDAALAYALQEALQESEAAEAAAARWSAPAASAAAAGAGAARLLASAFAGPWHAVCSAATTARLAGQRLATHTPRPLLASAAASADIPAERRRLDATLAHHALVERVVTGDGACQFRAVADQLYGSEAYHPAIREAAVRQLTEHGSTYSSFVSGEPYGDYVRKMGNPREWGDAITLQAIADAYGVRIIVVSSYEQQPFIEVTPASGYAEEKDGGGSGGGSSARVLYLSFFAEVHYNSVYAAPRVAVLPADGSGEDNGAAPWTPERARRQVESEP